MELQPNVDDRVVLRDQADREYASRVQDLGAGLLVVARPTDLPTDGAFAAGADIGVVWADSRGDVIVMPTRVLAAHAQGNVPLLSLVVTGSAVMQQRRRHERVAADGPVAIRAPGGRRTGAVKGRLVDVSEGAVRCVVAAGAADRFLGGRNEVVAEFHLGTVEHSFPGRAEFLRATRKPAQFEELVVLFDEPADDDHIARRRALAEQVQSLGAAQRGSTSEDPTSEDPTSDDPTGEDPAGEDPAGEDEATAPAPE